MEQVKYEKLEPLLHSPFQGYHNPAKEKKHWKASSCNKCLKPWEKTLLWLGECDITVCSVHERCYRAQLKTYVQ